MQYAACRAAATLVAIHATNMRGATASNTRILRQVGLQRKSIAGRSRQAGAYAAGQRCIQTIASSGGVRNCGALALLRVTCSLAVRLPVGVHC